MRRYVMLVVVLAVGVVGGVAYAQQEADTFTGCLTPGGDVKNVALGSAPTKECTGQSVQVSWNIEGVTGETGPQGEQGPPAVGFGDFYRKNAELADFPAPFGSGTIYCDPGDVATGGGHSSGTLAVHVRSSYPVIDPSSGVPVAWFLSLITEDGFGVNGQIYVVCADTSQ